MSEDTKPDVGGEDKKAAETITIRVRDQTGEETFFKVCTLRRTRVSSSCRLWCPLRWLKDHSVLVKLSGKSVMCEEDCLAYQLCEGTSCIITSLTLCTLQLLKFGSNDACKAGLPNFVAA